ncbi:hypothetical protein Q3G72_022696 [Acer saccharum]|nr:hypothetical protein Q3G72_022696 [Acer saccharum]
MKTKTQKLKTVVYKRPGEPPVAVELKTIDLEYLQSAVRGYVQAVPFAATTLTLWCNEEGKLDGLAPNVFNGGDVIMGTVVITGGSTPAGNTKGLTPKQAEIALHILSNLEYRR